MNNISTEAKIGRNETCPCGSGLKYKKCCGNKTSNTVGSSTSTLFQEAQAHLQSGRLENAIQLYKQILDKNPEHSDAMHYLGVALFQNGASENGLQWLSRSLELKPDDATFHNNMGMVLEKSSELAEAERHFTTALKIDSENIDAKYNLARIWLLREQVHKAVSSLNQLALEYPEDFEIQDLYAQALIADLEEHKAIELCKRTLAIEPGRISTRRRYAEALKSVGYFPEAEALYEQLFNEEQENIGVALDRVYLAESQNKLDLAEKYLNQIRIKLTDKNKEQYYTVIILKAILLRRKKQYQQALEQLKIMPLKDLPERAEVLYFFELGEIEDKLGHFDAAFKSFVKANNLRRESQALEYSREERVSQNARLKSIFTNENCNNWSNYSVKKKKNAPAKQRPIFILGFPRSGTTLVEQIIASHPAVCPGGELRFMTTAELSAAKLLKSAEAFPECLMSLNRNGTEDVLPALNQIYIDGATSLEFIDKDTPWFTDKAPLNSERLAMIHLLFPDSPIIHAIRHPLDVCLSAFFTNFRQRHWYAHDIKDTAVYFKRVHELIEYYKQNIPDLKYLPVRYEDIVMDSENQVRRMLEFIGEPYDERCLEFHKSKRVARTASYAQVNQKLYTSSMYRYKKYREQVESIIPILMPVIESLGYTVDD